MRRQRNISKTKQQDETPDKGLNESEISNLPDKEFKLTVIKMLNEMGKSI